MNSATFLLKGFERKRITSNLELYVRPDGSDLNKGLENNAAGAKKTIQAAINEMWNYHGDGYSINVNVSEGTFDGGIYVNSAHVSAEFSRLNVIGASRTQTIVNETARSGVNGAVIVYSGLSMGVGSLTMNYTIPSGTTGSHYMFYSVCGSYVWGTNLNLNVINNSVGVVACSGFAVDVSSYIQADNFALTGSMTYAMVVTHGSYLRLTGTNSINGTVSSATAVATTCSTIAAGGTVTGTVTGKRYTVYGNGVIDGTSGANHFPGTIAGTVASGGQYL